MFEFDLEEDFCSIYVDETILPQHLSRKHFPRPYSEDVNGSKGPDFDGQ